MSTVTLQPIDDDLLPRLLDVAVTDADPAEVMPPVSGPPGWTAARRTAFAGHHAPADGRAYAVIIDGLLAGAARLTPAGAPGAVEAGIWLRRSVRGKGLGTEAMRLLIDEARAAGASAIVAETNAANVPAAGLLRTLGATLWEDPDSGAVHAALRVGESDD